MRVAAKDVISTRPRVSIVIPVYNGVNYLSEAIDSALAQTYPNLEVLVINDGSTDGGATERVALSYGDRIRYLKKDNGGVASALNIGIKEMSGEYFSWLSHDDLYVPDKVLSNILYLESLPENSRERTIVYSDYAVFTRDPAKSVPIPMKSIHPENFRYWLTLEGNLHGCTLLIPRSAFQECGDFDEMLRTTQDYDLWFRMSAGYRFARLNAVLVLARSHSEQGSATMSALAKRECDELHTRFIEALSRDEVARASEGDALVAYARLVVGQWRRGFPRAARRAARFAVASLAGASVPSMTTALGVLAFGSLRNIAAKTGRRLLPATARATIRKLLS